MARLRQVALIALAALIGRGVAGPCDIYGGAGTPCVAAHSTVRALYAAGAQGGARLYQLKRQSDNATLDIHALADGFADTAAHETFCAAAGPAPPSPVPGVGSTVVITSVALPALSFRHCYSQGFVTPSDGNADHAFKVVAALNGDATAVSFQSMNFPTQYVALVAGAEAGRLGIAPAPAASDASWTVAPATEGGVTLTLQGRGGLVMTVGGNLTGTCAHSYAAPDASVYAAPGASGAGAAWRLITSGYPALASCFIWRVYDQSPNGNDLPVAGPGINNPNDDLPVNATRHSITVGRGGRRAYGMWFETGQGYRAVNTSGVPRGNDPETLVMVTSGTHVNDLCCFDYGNSENDPTNSSAFVDGAMESINFSTTDVSGTWCGGAGHVGPWVLADLENGLYGCGDATQNNNNTPLPHAFVTALVKGRTDGFALKGGDATTGLLKTMYDGVRPPGYQPMRKGGAIILGVGGDNRRRRALSGGARRQDAVPGLSVGTFYEGLITSGASTDAADDAVQADIVAVGYAASAETPQFA